MIEYNRQSLQNELNAILNEDIEIIINREQHTFDTLTEPWNESLVLFGAGRLGKKTLSGLRKVGIEPLAFTDNNSTLWGRTINNMEVLSPQKGAQKFANRATFIVTIWNAQGDHRFVQTRKQLLNLQCKNVISFISLFWKYPDIFLPYYAIDLPHKSYLQADQIKSTFSLWADEHSCHEYISQLLLRLFLSFENLSSPDTNTQYFPDNLFILLHDEVFIDCGAFDGDTLRRLFLLQPAFKGKIIAFEPDPVNFKNLKKYLSILPKGLQDCITIFPLGISSHHESVCFSAEGTEASKISTNGKLKINVASLDEIIREVKPSIIKMDIEGFELEALKGACNLIKRNLPILAISVYHKPDHLWRIPLYIHSISEEYHFYLRSYHEEGWDLVCYAIPTIRLKKH